MDRYSDEWNTVHGVKSYDRIPTVTDIETDLGGWLKHRFNAIRWTHRHNVKANCPVCNYCLTRRTNIDMDFHQLEIRTTPDDSGVGHLLTYKLSNFQERNMDIDGMFWSWCEERSICFLRDRLLSEHNGGTSHNDE